MADESRHQAEQPGTSCTRAARIRQSNNRMARVSKSSVGSIQVMSGSSKNARIWVRAIIGKSAAVASRTVVTIAILRARESGTDPQIGAVCNRRAVVLPS